MPKVPAEVVYESYALKATFFYEKLRELGYFGLYQKIKKFIKDQGKAFTWELREEWGVSPAAWDAVLKSKIDPLLVFCHPKVLKLHPRFLRYYRSVSMLPVKGLKAISSYSGPEKVESGDKEIPEERLLDVVKAINGISSFVVEMSDGLNEGQIQGMMNATAGSYIEGSWRNKIGFEGERVVRTMIAKALHENGELIAITDKKDNSMAIDEKSDMSEVFSDINVVKTMTLSNNNTVFFSSEPDVELLDTNGKTLGAIEIKAGLDPAGALERLGAMFKSFDNILAKQPDAETILVASCITDEVDARLREAQSVRTIFILTDLINNKGGRADIFTNRVRSVLGLIEGRRM